MRTSMLVVGVLMSSSVLAQADAKSNKANEVASSKKTTELLFDDSELIEGDIRQPDGEFLDSTQRAKHPSLIRIREEFKDKLLQSVDEL